MLELSRSNERYRHKVHKSYKEVTIHQRMYLAIYPAFVVINCFTGGLAGSGEQSR